MTPRKKEAVAVEDVRLHDYELIYIISPEVVDEALENTVDSVSKFIATKGGTVSDVERWGIKRLAYPIKHCLEGNYVLVKFQISPVWSKELETSLNISENVLRHLLIKLVS